MANDNNKKSALKSTAEVVATTSTILVAGKTIATVVDSTATSVKDMYAEIKSDNKPQEQAAEGVLISEAKKEIISDATIQNEIVKKTIEAVKNNTPKPAETSEPASEYVEEITEDSQNTEIASTEPLNEEPEIISTEPLDEEQLIVSNDTPSEQSMEEPQVEETEIVYEDEQHETIIEDIPLHDNFSNPLTQEIGCFPELQNGNTEDFTIDMSNFDNEESLTPTPTDDIA